MKKVIQIPKLNNNSFLIDTHCHLDMGAYENDITQVLENAKNNGVRYVITIGIDLTSSLEAVYLAKTYEMVFAAIGVHPHDVDNCSQQTYTKLQELYYSNQKHIVGYGEIGLDYFKKYSTIPQQKKHFIHQLKLSQELGLPIIIHNREAEEDMVPLLKQAAPFEKGGVMHCFSGNMDFANQVLDLGLHISIPGVVTFKNAHSLREVVKNVPLNSLLVETDGPFLSPHPFRGKRNEPSYVFFTAKKTAEILEIPLETLASATSNNAISLFDLPIPSI
jgi:TatD DNase family protein